MMREVERRKDRNLRSNRQTGDRRRPAKVEEKRKEPALSIPSKRRTEAWEKGAGRPVNCNRTSPRTYLKKEHGFTFSLAPLFDRSSVRETLLAWEEGRQGEERLLALI